MSVKVETKERSKELDLAESLDIAVTGNGHRWGEPTWTWEGIKAAKCGADIVMADHFPPEEVRRLREALREINPDILVEASGNITSKTAVKYAGCADIVSLGELTHSPRAVHFSMDIEY